MWLYKNYVVENWEYGFESRMVCYVSIKILVWNLRIYIKSCLGILVFWGRDRKIMWVGWIVSIDRM